VLPTAAGEAGQPGFKHPKGIPDSTKYYGGAFVSHVTPETIPAGSQFSVLGRGFGTAAGKVTIGGKECDVVDWADHAISARAPDSAVIGKVEVSAGGSTLSGLLDVRVVTESTINLPAVAEVQIQKAPTNYRQGLAELGDTFVVTGNGFGTVKGEGWLGEGFLPTRPVPDAESSALEVTSWSDKSVELKLSVECLGETRLRLKAGNHVLLAPHGISCPEPPREE
jgi:hypothetical protein